MIPNKKHKSIDFYGKEFPRPTFLVKSGEIVRDRADAPLPPNAGLIDWAHKAPYKHGGLKPNWHGKQPRLPMRPFHAFVALKRAEVLEENPELKFDAMSLKHMATRQAALDWATLTEEEKRVFVDRAEADKVRYARELAEYERANPGYTGWAAEHHTQKTGVGAPKAKKAPLEKPDPPKAASEFFFRDKMNKAIAADPSVAEGKNEMELYKQFAMEHAARWQQMVENSGPKRKFRKMEKDDLKRYEEELQQPRFAAFRAQLEEQREQKALGRAAKKAAKSAEEAGAPAKRSGASAKKKPAGARKLAKAKAAAAARAKAVEANVRSGKCSARGKENSKAAAKKALAEEAAPATGEGEAEEVEEQVAASESEGEGVRESQLISRVPESQYEGESEDDDEEEDAEDYEQEGHQAGTAAGADVAGAFGVFGDGHLQNAEEETDSEEEDEEEEDEDDEHDDLLDLPDPDELPATQETGPVGVLGALSQGWKSVVKGTALKGVRRFLTGRTGDTPPKGDRTEPMEEDPQTEYLSARASELAAPSTAAPLVDRATQIAEGAAYVRRRVAKEFYKEDGSGEADLFHGTVIKYDQGQDEDDVDLWHIQYDDDDSESIGLAELKEILQPVEAPASVAEGQNRQEGRHVAFDAPAAQPASGPAAEGEPAPAASGRTTPAKSSRQQDKTPAKESGRTPGKAASAAKSTGRKRKADA
ncbi:hypothetical protein WJX72_006062 [[Myrmecia] bisecta]|uniref:HMG box domain-containing protein n=1 Tax=[Myrmecia] bisecta TaxID=41462 RepID=A0AAW1R7Z3_9CHLO